MLSRLSLGFRLLSSSLLICLGMTYSRVISQIISLSWWLLLCSSLEMNPIFGGYYEEKLSGLFPKVEIYENKQKERICISCSWCCCKKRHLNNKETVKIWRANEIVVIGSASLSLSVGLSVCFKVKTFEPTTMITRLPGNVDDLFSVLSVTERGKSINNLLEAEIQLLLLN